MFLVKSNWIIICVSVSFPSRWEELCLHMEKGSLLFVWCVFISVIGCQWVKSDVSAFPGPPHLLQPEANTRLLQFYVLRGYCIINQIFMSWDKSTALFQGSWMQLHNDILANMGEKTSSKNIQRPTFPSPRCMCSQAWSHPLYSKIWGLETWIASPVLLCNL